METERLILRPVDRNDVDDVFAYSRTANVGPNAGWKPHESREESLAVMEQIFLDQEGVFGITLKDTGKLIGSAGLIADPKRENDQARMLGYAIGEEYWGRGYMTEAASALVEYGFKDLGLSLISAYCYPHNIRSQRILEKCGFSREGTLKLAEKIYNGSIYDTVCWALLPPQKEM